MEEHIVKIISIEPVTHDVNHYRIEKPAGYSFIPGQATEVAINKPGWQDQRRPFTFTSLNEWDHLEFTIKSYPERKGVTDQLGQLNAGDELLIHDVWGAIQYKGEGTCHEEQTLSTCMVGGEALVSTSFQTTAKGESKR